MWIKGVDIRSKIIEIINEMSKKYTLFQINTFILNIITKFITIHTSKQFIFVVSFL